MTDTKENLLNDSIVCFGCSYTQGVGDKDFEENWPYFLSQMMKNETVVNMAKAGSSLLHAVYTLEYIQKNNLKPKFIFFQVTNPYRLTLRQKEITVDDFVKINDNFYMIDSDIKTCTPATSYYKWDRKYYNFRGQEDVLWKTEQLSLLIYAKSILKNHPHFLYPQEEIDIYQHILGDWCVKGSLFTDKFYEHNQIDVGAHLNNYALKKQAEYMMTKVY